MSGRAAAQAVQTLLDGWDTTGPPATGGEAAWLVKQALAPHLKQLEANVVGDLPPLREDEHDALMVALRQRISGQDVTPLTAAKVVDVLARLAGIELPDGPPPPNVVQL